MFAPRLNVGRLAGWWVLLWGIGSFPAGSAPVIGGWENGRGSGAGDEVQAGRLLAGELMCQACHGQAFEGISGWPERVGPDLGSVSSRFRGAALVAWLKAPHTVKPGTVMPDLLAGRSEEARDEVATALARYLWQLPGLEIKASRPPPGRPHEGRTLYHSMGCAACHEPELFEPKPSSGEALRPAVPLGLARSGSYHRAGLIRFLLDPGLFRPSHRMPRFPMNEQEAADLAAYLQTEAPAPYALPAPALDADRVRQGRDYFRQLGCANCHRVEEAGHDLTSLLEAPALEAPDQLDRGCLAGRPKRGVPWYDLSRAQAKALGAAWTAGKAGEGRRDSSALNLGLLALNCLACHERESLGGPDPERLVFFETTGEDLGDEGRLPPRLSGVGRKLTRSALEKIVRGEDSIRPYMKTRMPGFGGQHAEILARQFAEVDRDPEEKPTPREGAENLVGRNMWGRTLIGTAGLGCIQCHRLNGRDSLGINVLDLAEVPRRLRPEWFRDYLLEPAKYRPGTRMPAYWEGGRPAMPGQGGTAERQIDSLWVYLNEVDQSRWPEGLEKEGRFVLEPSGRPLVFRTFMKQAGLHAVAVGFPAGLHAALDSKNVAWAQLWKGAFLDAESTWHNRFTPLTEPLGESVVTLERGDYFGYGSEIRTLGFPLRFLGYDLDPQGIPGFLIEGGSGVLARDRLVPTAAGDSFKRELWVESEPREGEAVWVRLATSDHLANVGPHAWRVDERLKLEIQQPLPPIARVVAEGKKKTLWLQLYKPGENPVKPRIVEMEWD